jgi:DNA-binding beta-propeller fold protein YncE
MWPMAIIVEFKNLPRWYFPFKWTIGSAPLALPRAISIYNNVYIADWNNGRILVFDTDGRLIRTWGVCRNGDGQFDDPLDIAVGEIDAPRIWQENLIYVADANNNRIQAFEPKVINIIENTKLAVTHYNIIISKLHEVASVMADQISR